MSSRSFPCNFILIIFQKQKQRPAQALNNGLQLDHNGDKDFLMASKPMKFI
jgi:hypothetical protein